MGCVVRVGLLLTLVSASFARNSLAAEPEVVFFFQSEEIAGPGLEDQVLICDELVRQRPDRGPWALDLAAWDGTPAAQRQPTSW